MKIRHEYSTKEGRPSFVESWVAAKKLIMDNGLVEIKLQYLDKMTPAERENFFNRANLTD